MTPQQIKQKETFTYLVNVSTVTFFLHDLETGINIHHHFFLWRVGDTPVTEITDYWKKRLNKNLFNTALEIINHNEAGEIYQAYNDPKRIRILKQYLLNRNKY
jgi:hypothetical protein